MNPFSRFCLPPVVEPCDALYRLSCQFMALLFVSFDSIIATSTSFFASPAQASEQSVRLPLFRLMKVSRVHILIRLITFLCELRGNLQPFPRSFDGNEGSCFTLYTWCSTWPRCCMATGIHPSSVRATATACGRIKVVAIRFCRFNGTFIGWHFSC